MREQRSQDDIDRIDRELAGTPVEPVLALWEQLSRVGGMPAMTPEHVREIAWALHKERQQSKKERGTSVRSATAKATTQKLEGEFGAPWNEAAGYQSVGRVSG